jgi:ABC-type antimicrobial peptide transport system permease subunit
MLKNYFKIAWRNIVKSRFYSLVNVLGLSAGIAFTLLISAYVWSELQVNNNLKDADAQYIIQSKWKDPNMGDEGTTLGPLAKELKERYPDLVANYYRYDGITSNVSKGDKSFREGLQVCDSTMLSMYGFTLMHGNPATAFGGPFSVIITGAKAIKYFGRTDVVGQTITIENFSGSKHDFIITGVLNKYTKSSVTNLVDDYPNEFYISSTNLSFFGRNMDWNNPAIAGYIELQKGVTPKDLEKPMQYLIRQNAPAQIAANMGAFIVPLKEYYLKANNGLVQKMISALSFIALFILLMAVINFINMAVSRSSTRMREIGIRKVLGGLKKQLVIQFLVESVMLVLFATLFALIIYLVTQNLFSSMLGKNIPPFSTFPFYFIFLLLLFILFVGIIAGLYPAFVLSSLKSVDSLKGKLTSVKESVLLRKSLVVFQFVTATIVFIGAIIISQQINFFFSGNLGYNKNYILSAQVPRDWSSAGVDRMEDIRKKFAAMPQLENATLSFEVPNGANSGNALIYKNGADSATAISSQILTTDEYYASTYSIPMAAGIFYSKPGVFTDSTKLVINETQAKVLGWKNAQDAIGGQLKFQGDGTVFTIAGVTKDFHFGSMQKAVQPITFLHVGVGNIFRFLSFKLKPGDIGNSIAALQKQWAVLMPGTPFEYTFMDDTLAKLYKSEIQLKKASYAATLLTLVIVLLGVLGLISLSIQRRTKEIGIRKVLGSSVTGIIALFMKEFLTVICIAGIIAFPLAYFVMQNWLNGYAYRINITPQPFLISILLLTFLTALLIGLQTVKSALSNPVKSLRTV